MTPEELKRAFDDWDMTAAQGAKILCLHSNKLSEYLGGVCRIPCALAFHIEALNLLDDATREQVFKKRLERKTHGAV